jgi:16S rRNA (cytosine967-C5)-methyltransferase
VNGVLRNIVRNPELIVFPDREKDITAALSVEYSMPEWIVKQFLAAYGEEKTEEILQAFSKEYHLTVRTNVNRTTPEKLAGVLRAQGMDVNISEQLPYALEISGYDRLSAIPQFLDGDFYVQDISSMMVAEWANVKSGDTVIDVCAAPGGKSTHIAEMLKGTGHVTARDLTGEKVALIRENISRHGLSNMDAEVMDATVFDEKSEGTADVLICDLPCSGLGVLGKKTDIRYKMTPEKQEELVKLQRQILHTVCAYVRQGGTLLYSTCTIHRGENEANVEWFLKEHPEFELAEMQQLLPGEAGQDGFFLAKMKRK